MNALPPLTAEQVMRAWEQGAGAPPPQQALSILDCATDGGGAHLATLSVGERDRLLLRLRADTFGSTMTMRIACPRCGRVVRAAVDVSDVEQSGAQAVGDDFGGERELRLDGWTLRYRLPTAGDALEMSHLGGTEAARALLLRRCVSSAFEEDRVEVDPGRLPEAVVDALAEALEAWDPLIETALAMECGACAHVWHAILEIAQFLHAEIADAASRLIREVDELARRYNWREADILGMSAARRQAYLNLTG